MSKVFIVTGVAIPHDGVFSAVTIPADEAGRLIADAIDSGTAEFHIVYRNAVNAIEDVSKRTIGSKWLQSSADANFTLEPVDLMICAKFNAYGKLKVKALNKAALSVEDFDFVKIQRIG